MENKISFKNPEKQDEFVAWYADNKHELIEEFLCQWSDEFKSYVTDQFHFHLAEQQTKHNDPDAERDMQIADKNTEGA